MKFIKVISFISAFIIFSVINAAQKNEKTEVIVEKGRMIFKVDWYGAKGTDFLLEKNVLQNDRRLKGWIVMIDGEKNARVVFYGKNTADGYTGYHQATFSRNDVTYQDVSKKSLGKEEVSLIKARELVVSQFRAPCKKRYNSAVFFDKEKIAVYMLTSTTDPNEIPMGGSEVFYTDLNGEKIIEKKSFFNSCISLNKSAPNGGTAVALTLSQVIGNIPNEIIVFTSLNYKIPIYVITPDKKTWKVENGAILETDMKVGTNIEPAATIWSFEYDKNGAKTGIKLESVVNPVTKENIDFKVPDKYISEVKRILSSDKTEETEITPGKRYFSYFIIDLNNPDVVITDFKKYQSERK